MMQSQKSLNIGFFYDFDLTLTEEYQQFPLFRHFIAELTKVHGITRPEEYWKLTDCCDKGIGYMQAMINDCEQGVFNELSNKMMEEVFAKDIALAHGLPEWFDRIRRFCAQKNTASEHHVISVGILPLIKGTSIFPYLDSVMSGEFYDGESGITKIKGVVEPYKKVECIKRICKGNELYRDLTIDEYHILYRNSIVFGDGLTDVDCFRYVKQRGGIAICVFEKDNLEAFERAMRTLGSSVNYVVPRDYSPGSVLENVVLESVDRMNNDCDMDAELVHNHLRGQIINKDVRAIVDRHVKSCDACKDRMIPKFYFR